MTLEDCHYQGIIKSDGLVAVDNAYWFVVNHQKMTSVHFSTLLQSIQDILVKQDVEYAVLMMAHGTFVFTQGPITIDPVLVKLTFGINFEGRIKDAQGLISQINSWLERNRT